MKNLDNAVQRTLDIYRAVSRRIPAWAVLCAAAAVMLTVGALRGEAGIQLQKAIRVCLECIGIG